MARKFQRGNSGDERWDAADWRQLVAELVIELGWSRDQVLDQIDLPFLEDLSRAWADCPPLRRMVAAYLGIKPRDREPVDLPEGSFEKAKAATDYLFKDPARFFQKPSK